MKAERLATFGTLFALLFSAQTLFGQEWKSIDIGNTVAGTTNISAGTFTIEGDGDDIWGTADGFRFVYLQGEGDCEIMARVTSQENTFSWAKAGVMIRQSLDPGSKHAYMCRTPGNGVAFQWRPSTDGSSNNNNGGDNGLPRWVRLKRVGNTFSGYSAPDSGGKPGTWTQRGGSVSITMTGTVYVGLAVTSHDYGTLSTAVFDNVVTTGTKKVGAGIIIGRARPAPPPALVAARRSPLGRLLALLAPSTHFGLRQACSAGFDRTDSLERRMRPW